MKRFNSLQTGKWIARRSKYTCYRGTDFVSIPFKRESGLQAKTWRTSPQCFPQSFNSLQTGKWIASSRKWGGAGNFTKSFQFPSNGKVYCKSLDVRRVLGDLYVSIPFKRESVLQVDSHFKRVQYIIVSIPFKRESVLQVLSVLFTIRANAVSIPFKRESVLQEKPAQRRCSVPCQFQFPSNGKAYCKIRQDLEVG